MGVIFLPAQSIPISRRDFGQETQNSAIWHIALFTYWRESITKKKEGKRAKFTVLNAFLPCF